MERWLESFTEEQFVEIHRLMINEWWCHSRSLADVRAVIAGSDLSVAALDEEGRVNAFARVLTDGIFKAVLFDVIVRPDSRDTGLGKRLVDHVLLHPAVAHVAAVELYCPDRISGFYTSMGFDVSESRLHRRVRS